MNPEAGRRIEAWLQTLSLARALPVLTAVVALIAWNRGIALLYALVALLLATLTVAWLAPRLNLAGLDARRRLPATANEGDTVAMDLELHARGRLAHYMVELAAPLPWAGPGSEAPTAYFDRVRGSARLTLPVSCELRGVHTLGPLQVATAYPLGLNRRTRTLPGSETGLVVYPTPLPLRHLPLPATADNPDLGADTANRAGGSDLFLGVREYRHGDDRRRVHWSATARHDRLMVKEFEHLRASRLLIVLDLRAGAQAGEGRHSTLEYAVKIAVSVAHHALSRHHMVGLLGLADPPVRVAVGRGAHHYREMLEALARVQATGSTPYDQAVHAAQAELGQGGNLLLFEHGPGDGGQPTQTTRRHPAGAIRIRFDMASFGSRPGFGSAQDGAGGYLVRRGDDLARVFAR